MSLIYIVAFSVCQARALRSMASEALARYLTAQHLTASQSGECRGRMLLICQEANSIPPSAEQKVGQAHTELSSQHDMKALHAPTQPVSKFRMRHLHFL